MCLLSSFIGILAQCDPPRRMRSRTRTSSGSQKVAFKPTIYDGSWFVQTGLSVEQFGTTQIHNLVLTTCQRIQRIPANSSIYSSNVCSFESPICGWLNRGHYSTQYALPLLFYPSPARSQASGIIDHILYTNKRASKLKLLRER